MNKVIVIEWIDSVEYEDAEWKSQIDADTLSPMRIRSAGILIKEESSYITRRICLKSSLISIST